MEVRRVALEFKERSGYWEGYKNPHSPRNYKICQVCRCQGQSGGRSDYANKLYDEWDNHSGHSEFTPEQNGMPSIEWQTIYQETMKNPQNDSPQGRIYAETNAKAYARSANRKWKENLNPTEIQVLKDAGITPTSYEAREFLVKRKCLLANIPYKCSACGGTGLEFETFAQREEYLLWEKVEPPAGEGWQLWEDKYQNSSL